MSAPHPVSIATGAIRLHQRDGLPYGFDPLAGGFQVRGTRTGAARVSGDGLAAVWTRRALEREGYRTGDPVDAIGQLLHVACLPTTTGWRWRLTWNGDTSEHTSLAEVVATLRRRIQPATSIGEPLSPYLPSPSHAPPL